MSKMDEKEIKVLEKLCRISLTEEEEKKFAETLGNVLDYIKKLDEVDTEGVEPCSHVIAGIKAPLREDEPQRLIPREDFLKGAPEHVGGMVKVPTIIKDEL